MTDQYIQKLTKAHPAIREIWLIGSRANGTSRPDSDWDYVVWADDPATPNAICADASLHDPNIDLLLVNGNKLVKPWREADGSLKRVDLLDAEFGLGWQRLSETQAQYLEAKETEPGSFYVKRQWVRAELVYRRAQNMPSIGFDRRAPTKSAGDPPNSL